MFFQRNMGSMATRVIEGIEHLRELTGQEIAVGDWFEVSQPRIDAFGEATEDRQWIHIDAPRAAVESTYGSTIAHGFLTLSLLSHLSREAIDIRSGFRMRINYGLNRVRFPSAVPAGARIRGRFTVGAVEDVRDAVQVTLEVTVEIEGGAKPACVAEWVIRLY